MGQVFRPDRRTRGLLALSVVAGGIVLAWAIGRSDPAGEAGLCGPGEAVMLRRRAGGLSDPAVPPANPSRKPAAPVASVTRFSGPRDAASVVSAEKPDLLPPTLAKSFPEVNPPPTARWGTSMGFGLAAPTGGAEAVSVHKIVNGDTLAALAKQYLGSAERAGEIYEANRGLLTSPDALPIGLELRIPARRSPLNRADESLHQPAPLPLPPRKP